MKGVAFVVIILILMVCITEGVDKKRRKKAERSVLERRKECENDKCGNLVPLEAQNCILECISPECYRKTFAEPLEDGEVNVQLNKIFLSCARKNAKVMNKKRPPRAGVAESSAGASLAESDRSSSPRESVVLPANGVVEEAMEPVDEDEDEELSLEEEFDGDIFALEEYA